jgi:hypothetical protein
MAMIVAFSGTMLVTSPAMALAYRQAARSGSTMMTVGALSPSRVLR